MKREVSPLELFFDLVFVFAISQLSHHLAEHPDWEGAAQTAVLTIAVFGVWATTSFGTTLLDIALPRTKAAVIVVMGLGLYMNAGIAHAFSDSPWTFVAPLLLILFGFEGLAAVTAPSDVLRLHFKRALVWTAASAPLWIVGAAVDADARLWLWAIAALIDIAGVWTAHPLPGKALHSERLEFDADHMRERLRLFVILLLGETVLTIGRVVSDSPTDALTAISGLGVFAALVCLWATYFAGTEDLFAEHVRGSEDQIRSVRLAMNATYGGFAGLVALAVGAELVIAHPDGHGSSTIWLLMFGGAALYMAAQAWYLRSVVNSGWEERLWPAVALALAGLLAIWLPPLASLAILDLILVAAVVRILRVQGTPGA